MPTPNPGQTPSERDKAGLGCFKGPYPLQRSHARYAPQPALVSGPCDLLEGK